MRADTNSTRRTVCKIVASLVGGAVTVGAGAPAVARGDSAVVDEATRIDPASIDEATGGDPRDVDRVARGDLEVVDEVVRGDSTVVGGSPRSSGDTRHDGRTPSDAAALEAGLPDGYEVYEGVIDRIVDGRHVVILLEVDGRVVDQLVEPREALPDVDEGDRLLVVLDDGELRFVVPFPSNRGQG